MRARVTSRALWAAGALGQHENGAVCMLHDLARGRAIEHAGEGRHRVMAHQDEVHPQAVRGGHDLLCRARSHLLVEVQRRALGSGSVQGERENDDEQGPDECQVEVQVT